MKRGKHQDVFAERLPGKAAPDAKQLRKLAGDWLKLRRADAELSQADLAARLGLKIITLSSHRSRTGSAGFQLKLWGHGPTNWVLNRRLREASVNVLRAGIVPAAVRSGKQMSVVAFECKQDTGEWSERGGQHTLGGAERGDCAGDRPRMGNRRDGRGRRPVLSAEPAAGSGLRVVRVPDRRPLHPGRRIGPAAVRASQPRSLGAAREGRSPVDIVARWSA